MNRSAAHDAAASSTATTSNRSISTARSHAARSAVVAILQQQSELLGRLSDNQFVKAVPGRGSPIGGHVRHCLDHVSALLGGLGSGEVDYDARCRGTAIETDRTAAMCRLRELQSHLQNDETSSDAAITVYTLPASDGPSVACISSFGRELAFVLSHTIHHNAMIAAIAADMGVELPNRFGYAPATVAYLDRGPCAPSAS